MALETMDMSKEKAPREVFLTGRQRLQILSMEDTTSSKGNRMFVVEFLCIGNGATDTFYLIAEQGKRWLLKSLIEAVGVYQKDDFGIYTFDPEKIVNKEVDGEVVNYDEDWVNPEGNTVKLKKNRITKFYPVEATPKSTPSVSSSVHPGLMKMTIYRFRR